MQQIRYKHIKNKFMIGTNSQNGKKEKNGKTDVGRRMRS